MTRRAKKVAGLTIKPGEHPQALRRRARTYQLQAQRALGKALALCEEADRRDEAVNESLLPPLPDKAQPGQEDAFMLAHLGRRK